MDTNKITAIGVWIIAIGVIAVGAKYGIKEYKNLYWKNNSDTSKFSDINSECLRKSIMNTYIDQGNCIGRELRDKGLSVEEYNEWAEWYNSKRLR